jgi:hypothetical protein
VTGDGRVTVADYTAEYLAIFRGSHSPRYDVNHDGRVNWTDLSIVAAQVGTRCQASTR